LCLFWRANREGNCVFVLQKNFDGSSLRLELRLQEERSNGISIGNLENIDISSIATTDSFQCANPPRERTKEHSAKLKGFGLQEQAG
jgi:hypothetical protein